MRLPVLVDGGLTARAAWFICDLELQQTEGIESCLADLANSPAYEGRVVTIARTGKRLVFSRGMWRIERI